MGNIVLCCRFESNEGELFVRDIIKSLGITKLTDMKFMKEMKERSKDNFIKTTDFFDYMENYWSKDEEIRHIQIRIFRKYFSATNESTRKEANIYELCLLFLPLFKMPYEEKRKSFEFLMKANSSNETLIINIKDYTELLYSFHTVYITKIIHSQINVNERMKENKQLNFLIGNVYSEDNINTEINLLFDDFKTKDFNKLSSIDIEVLSGKVLLDFDDIRDSFLKKYIN